MQQSGGNGRRGGTSSSRPSSDDEVDTPDNMSVISSISDDGYRQPIIEEGTNPDADSGETDESANQQNFEDGVRDCIDGLIEKSHQTRIDSLTLLSKTLSMKYMYDFITTIKFTIVENLTRCLKKGKGDVQALAAQCISHICIQLGEESENMFEELRDLFLYMLNDPSTPVKTRQQCAQTLAICSFVACRDITVIKQVMVSLENVFKNSYVKGEKSAASNTSLASFHSSALSAWTLLLSIAPDSYIQEMTQCYLSKITSLLESPDVELRIVAGETIALMYELQRGIDEDFEGENMGDLCDSLKQLATDGSKHRAKKDRRQQRSTFRDVLRSIEEFEYPVVMIKIGTECLYLDSWARKKQYDSFCQLLGSGTHQHFQTNLLLRDVFDLGAPPLVELNPSQRQRKMTKGERNFIHITAEKTRTRARAKNRDKRAVTVSCY